MAILGQRLLSGDHRLRECVLGVRYFPQDAADAP
jgi:hypothetical protein